MEDLLQTRDVGKVQMRRFQILRKNEYEQDDDTSREWDEYCFVC